MKYLNGFTIISFNHKNKYVTFKAENYFFDEYLVSSSSQDQSITNNPINEETQSLTNNLNNYEYWIIEDGVGTNKIKILDKDSGVSLSNIKAGPIYDEQTAMLLLNYFNDLETF